MTQQAKKSPASQAAQATAKLGAAASKVGNTAFSAAESTQRAAQNVMNISGGAVREILASGTTEAQKAQEKMWEISREGVENLSRSADTAARLLGETVAICRDNLEAAIECCNVTSEVAREMTNGIAETCNRSFAESVELSKEAFSCRTLNDVMELQSKALRHAMDTYFEQANKMFSMAFECCTEAMEPINERVSEASEQFCKALAA